ncbi:MAG: redoxin domain-containing protein [Fibrobacter sp.]|nr:redoxin domain-containing protein [Fibrobacter sp.]
MSIKKLLILVLIAAAAFYIFKVKGFNPFSTRIKWDTVMYELNGNKTTLEELAGEKGTLIFTMGTWCPHCVREAQDLKSLTDFLRLHKIRILFGVSGYTHDEIHNWVYKQDLPWDWKSFYWENRFDEEFHIKKSVVPYLTAINRRGEIIYSKGAVLPANALSEICLKLLKSNK